MDRRIVADPGCAIPATRTRYLDTARAERGMERVTHAPRGMHPTRGGPEQQSTGRAPAGGMGRRRPAGGAARYMWSRAYGDLDIGGCGGRYVRRAVNAAPRIRGSPFRGCGGRYMRRAVDAMPRMSSPPHVSLAIHGQHSDR